jgi:hypothetical protein
MSNLNLAMPTLDNELFIKDWVLLSCFDLSPLFIDGNKGIWGNVVI